MCLCGSDGRAGIAGRREEKNMGELRTGDKLTSVQGVGIAVKQFLGEGGQGAVYLIDYGGTDKALKWYHTSYLDNMRKKGTLKAFYDNLKQNIASGAPTKDFLWPQDVTPWSDGANASFGYVMDVRPKEYHELTDFFMENGRGRSLFASDEAMLNACIHIVEAFRVLHNGGYSYQDINNGNFFINEKTGKVLICDNDNVTVNEMNFGIGGKQRWMAPEVVMGGVPNKFSDRFSLAVVLFRILFFRQHPLEGQYSSPPCMTPEFEKLYYGSDPVFLFDPVDKRNAPVDYLNSAAMILWPMYPEYIHNLFIDTYGREGIRNPERRPVDIQWLEAFVRLKGESAKCPKCGRGLFLDPEKPVTCTKCKAPLRAPFNLRCGSFLVPIVPGSSVPAYIADFKLADCTENMAKVLRNQNTGAVGLGNLTATLWIVQYADGSSRQVGQREVAPIAEGMKLLVGGKEINAERV